MAENVTRGIYDSETQSDAEFIQRILIEVLGYVGSSAGDKWTIAKNQPVGRGNVDTALGHFTPDSAQILAPFELKGAKTRDLDAVMPGRNKTPVQQAWEYAMDAVGAQWVIVSNYREIRLYAVGYGRKNYESFDLSSLTTPEAYSRFMLLLSAHNLLSGNTKSLLLESDEQDTEITRQLYADYSELRANLVDEILTINPQTDPLDAVHFAQKVLDRILFIAFAEDKGLLPDRTLQKAYETSNPFSPQPVWSNFQGLFDAIDKGSPPLDIPGYNGGLFAKDESIAALLLTDELCEQFKKIGDYDFDSEVSVNILGHVFEQSVSDIEELKARIDPAAPEPDEKSTKRKREGIYYTPSSVTWFMVESTIGSWLHRKKNELGFEDLPALSDDDYDSIRVMRRGKRKGQVTFNSKIAKHIAAWDAYRNVLSNIKVLDPACGSGAFLIEAFDYLFREGQMVNNQLATLRGGQSELIRWDKHILSNNLYGVDINEESIEITKLSLWLKTANRSEPLTYLDDNICLGNSLVDDADVAGPLAFVWHEEFQSIFDDGGFDIVLGNPPYIDSEEMVRGGMEHIRDFITGSYNFAKGNWDIYIAFFERGFSLLSDGGELCYISPDKWLSKPFGEALRSGLFDHFAFVCEVGRGVFEDAKVDAILTKLTKAPQNVIQILRIEGDLAYEVRLHKKARLSAGETFDQLFSPHFELLEKLGSHSTRLDTIAQCENACATSDTYVLKELIEDAGRPQMRKVSQYKVANTGTLDRYIFKWGRSPMTYLKEKYLCPVVDKQAFSHTLGATYIRRSESGKIIIKGLTLLEGAVDLKADFIPGKSTLVIPHDDEGVLKFVGALINSKLISLYVKEKNRSSSYNQGVNFNPDMINEIPLAEDLDQAYLAKLVEAAMENSEDLASYREKFFAFLHAELGLQKVSRALSKWPDISFADFLLELKKSKIKLSLGDKADWQSHFQAASDPALSALSKLNEADEQINQAIYSAYGLTEAEIESVEAYGRR